MALGGGVLVDEYENLVFTAVLEPFIVSFLCYVPCRMYANYVSS